MFKKGDTVKYTGQITEDLIGQVGNIVSIPDVSNPRYIERYVYVRFWFDLSDTRVIHSANLRLVEGDS
jgi:hypothetical protein